MYTIYSKEGCVYCIRAKNLLTRKGITFEEKNVYDCMDEVVDRLGEKPKTVPQIFNEAGEHIGGFEELSEYLV